MKNKIQVVSCALSWNLFGSLLYKYNKYLYKNKFDDTCKHIHARM